MPIRKNIKISSAKRGHHERRKKNFFKTKKQLHQEKRSKTDIFKKSNNDQRKDVVKGKPQKKKNKHEEKDPKIRASDFSDMLSNDSDMEDLPVSKRRKIDNSDADDDEMSYSDSSCESSAEEINEEDLEKIELERSSRNVEQKELKRLLPIKTKGGLIMTRIEKSAPEAASLMSKEAQDVASDENAPEELSEIEVTRSKKKNVLTATELMHERMRELDVQKFRIGKISSGITENPEDKIGNMKLLLQLLGDVNEETNRINLLSVRKLAMFSLTEIFKDITPDYKIGIVDLENQKVKKDTLARVTFENELLKYYKNFLRELENIAKALKPGKYSKRPNKESTSIAESAVYCLCEIITAHPYFNFNTNIAQLLVIYLNSSNSKCRKMITETFVKIFKTDKRLDLTLHIVRNINYLVKKKSNSVYSEVVSCLLALQIKNINVDAEKEAEMKQKRLEQQKSRLINMSKRERKRKKKLSDLDKELMETQAEENKQTKQVKLTDISKLVFTIYFRILKESPKSKILNFTLEGLAKFAHIINIEFFTDLINVLNSLIESKELGYREQLYCIQTVFTILSGQGQALNIDPARFYTHLYRNILRVSAGKNHADVASVLETLDNILIKKRKNLTHLRYIAFLKRLMTLSLHVLHNGTLGCLAIVKHAMQLNSSLDILIDTENQVGSGQFNPYIEEPEFSNSNCTSLFELRLLKQHYHPIIIKLADYICRGCPVNQGLEPTISKMTPIDFFNKFDSTQMAFNPPIPCPHKETMLNVKIPNREKLHSFKLKDVDEVCSKSIGKIEKEKGGFSHLKFNFYEACQQ